MKSISITRRLVGTLLLLEVLSALALMSAVTVHEYRIQLQALDASLAAASESLMGAVQDAEDKDDNVLLDLRTVRVTKDAVYRVEDEKGRVLGSLGNAMPARALPFDHRFHNVDIGGRRYRFYTFQGLRIVDPGDANGGTRHTITVIYGTPVGHVWHEVFEEIRFFAIATLVLLGVTAVLMVWVIRKHLGPVRELAREADRISSRNWHFDTPASAKEIVELRPLANALKAALERVQRSFEQQKRFTSDAAHELKTDVAIVKSSLQLLSMRKRTVEEYSQGLTLSLDDFTRLENTVQNLLTLARLEQSEGIGIEEENQPSCSLLEAAEEAVYQSRPLAELRTIEITIESADEASVPINRHDAVLLCSNLFVNALQHSPVQGKVLISLKRKEAAMVLTVQDGGDGISEQDRPYLFHPFYRSDISRSRKSGGTGLGLSICKAICDKAGGFIDIANHPEGGALVTVTLPLHSQPETSSPLSASIKAE